MPWSHRFSNKTFSIYCDGSLNAISQESIPRSIRRVSRGQISSSVTSKIQGRHTETNSRTNKEEVPKEGKEKECKMERRSTRRIPTSTIRPHTCSIHCSLPSTAISSTNHQRIRRYFLHKHRSPTTYPSPATPKIQIHQLWRCRHSQKYRRPRS